jgi:hypothetical protein
MKCLLNSGMLCMVMQACMQIETSQVKWVSIYGCLHLCKLRSEINPREPRRRRHIGWLAVVVWRRRFSWCSIITLAVGAAAACTRVTFRAHYTYFLRQSACSGATAGETRRSHNILSAPRVSQYHHAVRRLPPLLLEKNNFLWPRPESKLDLFVFGNICCWLRARHWLCCGVCVYCVMCIMRLCFAAKGKGLNFKLALVRSELVSPTQEREINKFVCCAYALCFWLSIWLLNHACKIRWKIEFNRALWKAVRAAPTHQRTHTQSQPKSSPLPRVHLHKLRMAFMMMVVRGRRELIAILATSPARPFLEHVMFSCMCEMFWLNFWLLL